jgi:hypothetical protein
MQLKRLKNQKDANQYRTELLKVQNGIDPITNKVITDPCLDHQHFGNQQCRGVLQREVNSFEGKVQNAFNRYIKHLTADSVSIVLRRLADYLEQDYSQCPVHHTALSVEVARFKRMSAQQQKDVLMGFGIVPGINTSIRAKQFREYLK